MVAEVSTASSRAAVAVAQLAARQPCRKGFGTPGRVANRAARKPVAKGSASETSPHRLPSELSGSKGKKGMKPEPRGASAYSTPAVAAPSPMPIGRAGQVSRMRWEVRMSSPAR